MATQVQNKVQKYMPGAKPGDVVAMAIGMNLLIGIFKGFSPSGNAQMAVPYLQGEYYTKTALSHHTDRMVKLNILDLDPQMQARLKQAIDKYRNA